MSLPSFMTYVNNEIAFTAGMAPEACVFKTQLC